MKKLYEGKTKNVFELENGNVLLQFKMTAPEKTACLTQVKTA